VRQRDARKGRHRDGRRHARDHLEGDPGFPQDLGLLAAAAEDEGVPPLEAGHGAALQGLAGEDPVDLALGERVVPALLADIDEPGILARAAEKLPVGQVVVHDDIGLPDALDPPHRDEPRVPGARADDENFPLFRQVALPIPVVSHPVNVSPARHPAAEKTGIRVVLLLLPAFTKAACRLRP